MLQAMLQVMLYGPRFWAFCSWVLVPGSWALCSLLHGRFVPGSWFLACLRVVARCFKGRFVGGSMRVGEDILLSERDGKGKGKGNGRASWA